MTKKHEVLLSGMMGFFIVVGLGSIMIVNHNNPGDTQEKSVNQLIPKQMVSSQSHQQYFTKGQFPNELCGVYAMKIPLNVQGIQNYYQLISMIHITPHHMYQQMIVVPKQQPMHFIKTRVKSHPNESQFVKHIIARENKKKQIIQQNIQRNKQRQQQQQQQNPNQANVFSHPTVKKVTKKPHHKKNRIPYKLRKVQEAIPKPAQSIIHRSHLTSLAESISMEVEPGRVTKANDGEYNIQLKEIQRLEGYNYQNMNAMGIPEDAVSIPPKTTSTINLKISPDHKYILCNNGKFKRMHRKQAVNLINMGNVGRYFVGF